MLQYISPDSCYHNILDVHSGLESAVQADIIYAGSLYAAGNTLKEDNMVTDIPAFPTFGWICKLNESRKFSGSIGTSKTGTFTVHTIEYHIWKKEVQEGDGKTKQSLCADCRIKPPYGSGKDVFGQDETQCGFSEENAGHIKEWLLEHVNKWECIEQM